MNLTAIQTEVDAAYLYARLAEQESDPVIAKVYSRMSDIEKQHALSFLSARGLSAAQLPAPSWRARTLNRIGKIFGYDYVLGNLMDTEKNLSRTAVARAQQQGRVPEPSAGNHVKILRSILEHQTRVSGPQLAKFESRHRSVGGNALRAAVLGGNDGLVSNFSLVMGVAGASAGGGAVLLAGMAGLLAGALSMALGEWISVKSSQELFENQMQLEMEELQTNPEGEQKELELIYMAKGVPEEQAIQMAAEVISKPDKAHEVLIAEELGINPKELEGSAMEAALYSFFLFAIGAIIPVIPFFFLKGYSAIWLSVGMSAAGLFLIGAAITLFTGRSVWYSGFRQVFFGLAAAAITFGIGKWLGVAVG